MHSQKVSISVQNTKWTKGSSMKEIFADKDVVVIGNALSLNEKKLESLIGENTLTCAFNRGVERFKPDVAFLSIADGWNTEVDIGNAVSIHVSSEGRPSLTADYTIPMRVINKLKPHVGYRPSSGCIANAFLSQRLLGIKSVTLIGFDFKQTPTYYDQKTSSADEPHDYVRERKFTISYFIHERNYNII